MLKECTKCFITKEINKGSICAACEKKAQRAKMSGMSGSNMECPEVKGSGHVPSMEVRQDDYSQRLAALQAQTDGLTKAISERGDKPLTDHTETYLKVVHEMYPNTKPYELPAKIYVNLTAKDIEYLHMARFNARQRSKLVYNVSR